MDTESIDEINHPTVDNKENGSTDVTSPTSLASNSSLMRQDLNDKSDDEEGKPEVDGVADGQEESESSSEEESSDEDSVDDLHLSDYGKFCNQTIQHALSIVESSK